VAFVLTFAASQHWRIYWWRTFRQSWWSAHQVLLARTLLPPSTVVLFVVTLQICYGRTSDIWLPHVIHFFLLLLCKNYLTFVFLLYHLAFTFTLSQSFQLALLSLYLSQMSLSLTHILGPHQSLLYTFHACACCTFHLHVRIFIAGLGSRKMNCAVVNHCFNWQSPPTVYCIHCSYSIILHCFLSM